MTKRIWTPVLGGLSFGAAFFVSALFAAIINPLPYVFQNGTTADATQVNADFAQIVANVNTNAAPIVGSAFVPSNAVMAFNLAACPVGWILADGTGGTPDLRGYFVRGVDAGRGIDPGRALADSQADQMPQHSHSVNQAGGSVSYAGGGTFAFNFNSATSSGLAGTGTETRVKNVALRYCVKS